MAPVNILDLKKEFNYPDAVNQFISKLFDAYHKKNKRELNFLYDFEFKKITDDHFKNKPWPSPEAIFHVLPCDDLFQYLYKELYYRHIYLKLEPRQSDRQNSFKSYFLLFRCLTEVPDISFLPNHWLWDMFDEFVYQFQWNWSKVDHNDHSSDSPTQNTSNHTPVWSLHTVLSVLRNLVLVSGCCLPTYSTRPATAPDHDDTLESSNQQTNYSATESLAKLGCFALVSILRVQIISGDFFYAIKTTTFILQRLHKLSFLLNIPACAITLCRYAGYLAFFVKRYTLAQSLLSYGVLCYWRSKSILHSGTYHYELATKRSEQMLVMLALLFVTYSSKTDDSVIKIVQERYSERIKKLQNRDFNVLRELYYTFAPKIVYAMTASHATPAILHEIVNYSHELRKRCNAIFTTIEQQLYWSAIKSLAINHKQISISKISEYLKKSDDSVQSIIQSHIYQTRYHLSLNEKTHSSRVTDQLSIDGAIAFSPLAISNVVEDNFILEGNTLVFRDNMSSSDFRLVFMNEISRMKQLNCDLQLRMFSSNNHNSTTSTHSFSKSCLNRTRS